MAKNGDIGQTEVDRLIAAADASESNVLTQEYLNKILRPAEQKKEEKRELKFGYEPTVPGHIVGMYKKEPESIRPGPSKVLPAGTEGAKEFPLPNFDPEGIVFDNKARKFELPEFNNPKGKVYDCRAGPVVQDL